MANHYMVFAVVFGSAVAIIARTFLKRSPRRLRVYDAAVFAVALLVVCVMAGINLWRGMSPDTAWPVGGSFVLLAVFGYIAFFRKPNEKEIVINYAMDPAHCGRCGYDLTGNTTGVCPECGWRILAPDLKWERQWEIMWFRPWRITYLHDWCWSLFGWTLSTLVWLTLAIRMVWSPVTVLAIVPALLVVYSMLHVIRVIDYGRRERARGRREDRQR